MRNTEPQISEPVRSLQTFLRRIAQNDTKIPLVIPDGIYSGQTTDAVTEFQNAYGIPATGVTDFDTWTKIVEIYDSIPTEIHLPDIRCLFPQSNYKIIEDQTADCLYLIQAMMTVLSNRYPHLGTVEISGTHTPDSVEMIRKVQELSDLEQTGVIDVHTYNAIVTLFNATH